MENPRNINYRYERKFFVSNLDRVSAEKLVLHHPAFFSEIYHERYVNNLYFDYPAFQSYADSNRGNPDRVKTRIRWYGDLFGSIQDPVLELKIKRGFVGFKKLFPLNALELGEGIHISEIRALVRDSPWIPKSRFPCLTSCRSC